MIVDNDRIDIDILNFIHFDGIEAYAQISEDKVEIKYNCQEEDVWDALERHTDEYDTFGEEEAVKVFIAKGKLARKWMQEMMDEVAQQYGYDDMKSVRSYTGYDNYYRDECIRLAQWCSKCWVRASELEQEILDGDREFPASKEEVIELLPKLDDE